MKSFFEGKDPDLIYDVLAKIMRGAVKCNRCPGPAKPGAKLCEDCVAIRARWKARNPDKARVYNTRYRVKAAGI